MSFQEDIENIQSFIYKSLKPLMWKGKKRFIRVQISKDFFLQWKRLKMTGRFKDATHLVGLLNLPFLRVFILFHLNICISSWFII